QKGERGGCHGKGSAKSKSELISRNGKGKYPTYECPTSQKCTDKQCRDCSHQTAPSRKTATTTTANNATAKNPPPKPSNPAHVPPVPYPPPSYPTYSGYAMPHPHRGTMPPPPHMAHHPYLLHYVVPNGPVKRPLKKVKCATVAASAAAPAVGQTKVALAANGGLETVPADAPTPTSNTNASMGPPVPSVSDKSGTGAPGSGKKGGGMKWCNEEDEVLCCAVEVNGAKN
ncbi:hypothetical protein ACHAW6_002688, partial [Cyclotella cf. meneghiniana]